jgi:hypothetical protein
MSVNDMQEFIQSAAQSIGVSGEATKSATGGLLNLIKKQAGQGDFDRLLGNLPGADAVASAASDSGSTSMLGGIGKALGGALGGKLSGSASVLGVFEKSGLDLGQAGQLASMFFNFAKGKAGSELIDQILGKMPEIKKLLG